MNATFPPPPKSRNKVTEARHRREAWLQIYLPLGAATLLFLAAVVFVGIGSFGGTLLHSAMADTAAVWLSIPVAVVALLVLALVGGLAYGIGWLTGFLPPYFKQGQDIALRVMRTARRSSGKVAGPIVGLNSRAAAVQNLWQRLRSRLPWRE